MNLTGNVGSKGAAPPQAWLSPTTDPVDVRAFTEVEIQLVGTPVTPYTPQRSLDGTTFVACKAFDVDLNPVSSISAAGIYTIDGGGHLKMGAGSGSTITVRAAN